MRRSFRPALTLALTAAVAAPVAAQNTGTPLFNGRDLAGWTIVLRSPKDPAKPNPDPRSVWTVSDGVLKCTGRPNGYLATAEEYANYVLHLKWRWPAGAEKANSGVLLHVQKDNTKDWPQCVECQLKAGFAGDLWLTYPPAVKLEVEPARLDPKQARRLVRIGGPEKQVEKPAGEWNQCKIVSREGEITVAINGEPVNDAKNGSLKRGRIALQSEGSPVEFKDIEIKLLK